MRIISKKRIHEFVAQYSDSEASLLAWHDITKRAEWNTSVDVKKTFTSVDMVNGRFVFDIARNRYRLVAHINFSAKRVFVLHILTHKEYDKGRWKQ